MLTYVQSLCCGRSWTLQARVVLNAWTDGGLPLGPMTPPRAQPTGLVLEPTLGQLHDPSSKVVET
jgi:hypothetical protein